jgi:hypothetical protein
VLGRCRTAVQPADVTLSVSTTLPYSLQVLVSRCLAACGLDTWRQVQLKFGTWHAAAQPTTFDDEFFPSSEGVSLPGSWQTWPGRLPQRCRTACRR